MSNTQDMTKLGTIDDIIRSLDILDENGLRETLAYIIKTYVIDGGLKTTGIENKQASYDSQTKSARIPVNYSNFRELIMECQKMYPFPELKRFTVEANTLYVNIEGEKHLFEETEIRNATTNNMQQTRSNPEPERTQEQSPQERDGTGGRFSNLELD